jgi:lipoprotein-releasing system permease protein
MLTRFIALRYARAGSDSRLLGFIARVSMAGLVIAVALLITVLSVMNGFEHELRTRILRIVPAITLSAKEGEIEDWKSLAMVVLRHERVKAASPLIEAQGLLVAGALAEPVLLFATDPEAESRVSHFEDFTDAASWSRWRADPGSVLVSRKLAHALGLEENSQALMMLPGAGQSGSQPDVFSVPVAGFYETGTEVDNHLVLAQLPLLQTRFGMQGVSAIRFTVTDWMDVQEIVTEMAPVLPLGMQLRTWLSTHGNLYDAIRLSRQLVVLMLVLIVVVAAFNVVCSLVLVVSDKRGDIAILRAMGLPNARIMRLFVLHGAIIGAWGTALGAALGVALSLAMPSIATGLQVLSGVQFLSTDIYPVNYLPSDLRLLDVLVVVGVAMLLSALASVYPAWRATQLQPADVLRHE